MRFSGLFRSLSRAALGGVFIVSGFQKLLSPPQNFAAVIDKFEVIHGPAVSVLALVLPWVEFIGGVMLLLGLWTRFALPVLWAMNTAFIGILGSALVRKLPVNECGCFGKALSIPLPVMFGVDAALWALFLFCFLSKDKPSLSLDSYLARA